MAEIPLGNFGVRGADPAQRSQVNTEGFDAVNVALNRAAGTGMAIAGEALDEQKRQQRAMKQVEAANAIGQAQLKTETVKQQIMQDMREGKLSHEQADKAYQEAIQAVEMPKVEGLDPVMQAQFDGQIGQLGQRGRLDLMPHIEQAKIGKFQSDIDGILDAQSKRAGLPGADIEGINAGIDAMEEQGRMAYGDKWEEKKRNFIEGNFQNHVQQRMMQAGDNLSALKAIEHDLAASDGYYADKIDAGKRLALQNNISNNVGRIEQHNEMLSMKREIRAQNILQDIERQNSSGIPATPDMVEQWQQTAAGTSSAQAVGAMVQQGQQIQEFLRVPIDQQQATIQQMETNLMQNGGSVQDKTNLDSLRRVFDANKKSLTESPLVYAQERLGAEVEPLDVDRLALSEAPDQAHSVMRDRTEVIKALRQKHGAEISMAPLLPQEVESLSSKLQQASPQEQTQILGNLKKSFSDNDAYVAAMKQISKDAPIQALAGTLSAKQKQIELSPPGWFSSASVKGSRDIAATILSGEKVLKENKGAIAMPKDSDFLASFDEYAGEAFSGNPSAKATAIDGVRAYYAGAVASGVEPEIAQSEALKAVVGGVTEHNGKKIITPYGMQEEDFPGYAKDAFAAALKENNMPATMAEDFEDYDVQPLGDGEYLIKIGAEYLSSPDGEPLTINLNRRK